MGDMLRHEVQHGTRMIDANDSFVTFMPYAAEVPFETWIVPRQQQADFGTITAMQKADFAKAVRDLLWRLHSLLNDPDYNLVLHTAARYKAGEPHLYWYLQVRPRLVTPAGFEIGSGMTVNPSLPEDDAQALRGVTV
jgi:UDPglucose--hexose-1-phosphate uridylyltransferase